MSENSAQEKTEQATPQKIRKAREKGQVAKSAELNSVIIVGFGFVTIYLLAPMLFGNLGQMMSSTLREATTISVGIAEIPGIFNNGIMNFTMVVGPILLCLAIIAYLINVVQIGVLFSPKSLEPKWDKFNLAKGLKNLVSKKAIVNLIRDIFKAALIGIIAYFTISGWLPDIMEAADKSVGQYATVLGQLALLLAIKICVVLLALAAFDFAFQRYDHATKLKMSKQEIKEESKDTEGSPQLKSRIRQVQREIAKGRMMTEIPDADVIVTNPTHIAVALKYDQDKMAAPKIVAKGQRLIAEKIKEIARAHNIPVVENKSLARSLFKLVDVGEYIPATLYKAAAEVLAYIYRVKESEGVSRG